MTGLPLTIISQTSLRLTLGWTPPAGATGYRFFRDGVAVSSSWDPAKNQITFGLDGKPHTFDVVAETALAKGTVTVNQPATPDLSARIYTADFAAGDFSQVDSQQESSAGRISLVQPGLAGAKYAARFLCGTQDEGVAGSSGNLRTELEVQSFSPHLGGGSLQGKDVWVAWAFKLGAGFAAPSGWVILTQFHAGHGSPTFALLMKPDGNLYVVQRGGAYVDNGGTSGNYKEALLLAQPARETEYRMVVYRRFSVNSDGATRVWLNRDTSDAPSVALSGPTLPIGYESATYQKCGMYGGQWSGDNAQFISDIRWAATAAGL